MERRKSTTVGHPSPRLVFQSILKGNIKFPIAKSPISMDMLEHYRTEDGSLPASIVESGRELPALDQTLLAGTSRECTEPRSILSKHLVGYVSLASSSSLDFPSSSSASGEFPLPLPAVFDNGNAYANREATTAHPEIKDRTAPANAQASSSLSPVEGKSEERSEERSEEESIEWEKGQTEKLEKRRERLKERECLAEEEIRKSERRKKERRRKKRKRNDSRKGKIGKRKEE